MTRPKAKKDKDAVDFPTPEKGIKSISDGAYLTLIDKIVLIKEEITSPEIFYIVFLVYTNEEAYECCKEITKILGGYLSLTLDFLIVTHLGIESPNGKHYDCWQDHQKLGARADGLIDWAVEVRWLYACGDAIKWLGVSEYLFKKEVKSNLAMMFPSPLKQQVEGTKHRKELSHYWKDDMVDGKSVSLQRHVDPISMQVMREYRG